MRELLRHVQSRRNKSAGIVRQIPAKLRRFRRVNRRRPVVESGEGDGADT